MASLLGICQQSGRIETKADISRELQGEVNVDDRNILKSKTIMMPSKSKKGYKIKSEVTTLGKNVFNAGSNSEEDPVVPVNKAFVKLTVAKKFDSKSALCDICSKTFGDKYNLKAHMKIHERKTIGKVSSKNTLTDSRKKAQCQVCFLSVAHLPRHMKNIHSEQKFVTCATCGQDKKAKNILKHEKRCKMSEEERAAYNATLKVECGKCGKILSHKHKLQRHMESVHNKSNLLKCDHCEHKDSRSDNLKTHMRNNHKNFVFN